MSFFAKKRRSWFHLAAASTIIAYWWALWNIFDVFFLHHNMTTGEIVSISIVGVVSVVLLFVFDFDFSDI